MKIKKNIYDIFVRTCFGHVNRIKQIVGGFTDAKTGGDLNQNYL